MLGYQADGTVVETIEGLAQGGALHPLQDAFIEAGGVQCGICIPGMVLAGQGPARPQRAGPRPRTSARAWPGNLCRCTGYTKIFDAVMRAAGQPVETPRAYPPEPATPSYYRPRSLEEALEILVQRGRRRAPAGRGHRHPGGGQGRQVRPRRRSSTSPRCRELSGIEEDGEFVRIGATATHSEMMASSLLHKYVPALPIGCSVGGRAADPQPRHPGRQPGPRLARGRHHSRPLRGRRGGRSSSPSPTAARCPSPSSSPGPRKTVLAPDELIVGGEGPEAAGGARRPSCAWASGRPRRSPRSRWRWP